jgi:peptidoglycan/xylan/chitin deacetylase (PgdA/CDA1 family)
MSCYRHPDRAARRKCFQCRKAICPECQQKLDGHIFCGEECHQAWLGRKQEKKSKPEKKPRVKPELRIALLEDKMEQSSSNWFKLEQSLKKVETNAAAVQKKNFRATIALLCGFILVLAGAIYALQSGLIKFPSKNIPAPSQPLPAPVAEATTIFDPGYPGSLVPEKILEPPNLELPPGEIPAANGRIDIYGRAPAAKKVTLLLAGREAASLSLQSPEFVFKAVQLGSGANIVQVMAADNKGNLAYSIAELVEYPGQEKAQVRYTPGLDYSRGSRSAPQMALTFDAGGDAGYASTVLEILRERGIKTTMFVTGQFIEQNPELVRQMVEDGHEVGNHTYSHPHLTTYETNSRQWTRPGMTREVLQKELQTTAKLFKETTAAQMSHFWRAPFGEQNPELRRWAEEVGYYHIDWSRDSNNSYDTLDWLSDTKNNYYRSPEQIRRTLLDLDRNAPQALNGAIVLMHISTDRGKDYPDKVIAPAIDGLATKGYKLVKVSALFPELAGK